MQPSLAADCAAEREEHCADVRPGSSRIYNCLLATAEKVSSEHAHLMQLARRRAIPIAASGVQLPTHYYHLLLAIAKRQRRYPCGDIHYSSCAWLHSREERWSSYIAKGR